MIFHSLLKGVPLGTCHHTPINRLSSNKPFLMHVECRIVEPWVTTQSKHLLSLGLFLLRSLPRSLNVLPSCCETEKYRASSPTALHLSTSQRVQGNSEASACTRLSLGRRMRKDLRGHSSFRTCKQRQLRVFAGEGDYHIS